MKISLSYSSFNRPQIKTCSKYYYQVSERFIIRSFYHSILGNVRNLVIKSHSALQQHHSKERALGFSTIHSDCKWLLRVLANQKNSSLAQPSPFTYAHSAQYSWLYSKTSSPDKKALSFPSCQKKKPQEKHEKREGFSRESSHLRSALKENLNSRL